MDVYFSGANYPDLLTVKLQKKYVDELITLAKSSIRNLQDAEEEEPDLKERHEPAADLILYVLQHLRDVSGSLEFDTDTKDSISMAGLEEYIDSLPIQPRYGSPSDIVDEDGEYTEAAKGQLLKKYIYGELKEAFSMLVASQEGRQDDYLKMAKACSERDIEHLQNDILSEYKHLDGHGKDGITAELLKAIDHEATKLQNLQRRGSPIYPLRKAAHQQEAALTMNALADFYDINLESAAGYQAFGRQIREVRKNFGLDDKVQLN